MKMRILLMIFICFFFGCKPRQLVITNTPQDGTISINGKIFTSLFQQRSAEYRALCFQAYNIARLRLDEYKPVTSKPMAIITDIDETLLDNSPYQVSRSLYGKDYDAISWFDWTSRSLADTMPGSASFLKYASSKNVSIFYVSNRDEKERAGTLQNLKRFKLPNADSSHFLPKQGNSSKESRRQSISGSYEIVLMLGDNLADFSALFDKKSMEERWRNTNFSSGDFGNRFIVLPNPVYGDWENALYKYNYKLTQGQKDSIIRGILKGY